MFKFCQQCGYKRKRAQDNEVEQQLKKVVVQESVIFERVEQLARQHQSSRYVRQKRAHHVTSTFHNSKWNHFRDISKWLVRYTLQDKGDYYLTRELKPTINDYVSGGKLYL